MARRRVNKKFLIILTCVVLVGGVAAVVAQKKLTRKDPTPFVQAAEVMLAEGNYEDAVQNYVHAVSLSPKDPALRVALGDALIQISRTDPTYVARARAEWDRAMEINPDYLPALERLFKLYRDESLLMPRPEPAIYERVRNTSRRLSRVDPENVEARAAAHVATIQAWIVGIATEAREIDQSIAALTELMEEHPENSELPFTIAQANVHRAQELLRLNQLREAADLINKTAELIDEALEQQPENPMMQFRAGRVYWMLSAIERTETARSGYRARASAATERARTLVQPDDPNYIEINLFAGTVAQQQGPHQAERIYREMLQHRPQDQNVRLALARLISNDSARVNEAIEILSQPVVATEEMVGMRALLVRHLETQTIYDRTALQLKAFAATTDEATRAALLEEAERGVTAVEHRLGDNSAETLKLRGELRLVKNEPVEAIQDLNRAMTLMAQTRQPRDYPMLFNLARAYASVQLYGQAQPLLEEILHRHERFAPARVLLCDILLRQFKVDEARPHVDYLEKQLPDEPDVFRLRIATLNYNEQRQEVMAYYNRLPERNRTEKLQKGQAAIAINNLEDAERLLAAAEAIDPSGVDLWQLYVRMHLRRNDRESALAAVARGLEHNPGQQALEYLRLQLQDASPDELKAFAKGAIAEIEDEFTREIQLAIFYRDQGNPEESFKHLSNARRIRANDPQLLDLLFYYHLQQAEFSQAEALIEALARANQDRAGGRLYHVRLALAQGDSQAAVSRARELTQRMPEFSQSWLALAQSLHLAGQHEEAAVNYVHALERQGTNMDALRGLIECYYAMGRPQDARRYIAQGRSTFPVHPWFLEQEVQYELNFGDPANAVAPREQAVRMYPEQAGAWLELGATHIQVARARSARGEQDAARQHIQKAQETLQQGRDKWPDESGFYGLLADVALMTNNFAEAEEQLQDLLAREGWSSRPEPHLMLAELHSRTGMLDKAEQSLRTALATADGGDAQIEIRLAGLLAQQGKVEEALKVLEARQDDPTVQFHRVELLVNSGRVAEAESELAAALATNPTSTDLLTMKGFLQLTARRFDEAIGTFNHVLQRNPRNTQALLYRGLAQFRKGPGSLDAAIRDLESARSLNPSYIDARLALVDAYRRNNNLTGAIRELEATLKIAPFNKPVRLTLVEMYMSQQPPRHADAERLLREAMNNPAMASDPDWLHAEALMWLQRDDGRRALERIEQARMQSPDNGFYHRTLLQVLMHLGQHQRLIQETDQLVREAPDAPGIHEVYTWRGIARRQLNDRDGAMVEFEAALNSATTSQNEMAAQSIVDAIALHVGVDEALIRIADKAEHDNRWRLAAARLHHARRDSENAFRMLDRVLEDYDNLSPRQRVSVLQVAGSIYLTAHPQPAADKAHDVYLMLLEKDPDDIVALNNLACLLVDNLNRPEQGLVYSQRAYDLIQRRGEMQPLIADTHGWALVRAGRVDEGIVILQQVVERHPFPEAMYHLAEAYLRRSNPDEAQRLLIAAADMMSDAEHASPLDAMLKVNIENALTRAREMIRARDDATLSAIE